jgi:hypothetical protein
VPPIKRISERTRRDQDRYLHDLPPPSIRQTIMSQGQIHTESQVGAWLPLLSVPGRPWEVQVTSDSESLMDREVKAGMCWVHIAAEMVIGWFLLLRHPTRLRGDQYRGLHPSQCRRICLYLNRAHNIMPWDMEECRLVYRWGCPRAIYRPARPQEDIAGEHL